ncbi:MAG: MFS transporter [Anaerolineae bacterium]|jgi:MFS family permease|nr:MFS transporter [Anaerolineae bacterium]
MMTRLRQITAWIQNKITHWLHIDLTKKSQRNGYYLIVEIFFATFLSAAASFNAAYAIRLGAADENISFMTSIPALIAVIISIPAGKILQNTSRKKSLLVYALGIHRSGYLLIVFAPFLQRLGLNSGALVTWMLILFMLPAQFFNIGFTSLTATIIKPEQRAAVFSFRNQIFFAVSALGAFLFGFWLDAVVFPLNYQIMYAAGFLISLISLFYVKKLELPERPKTEQKPLKETVSLQQRFHNLIKDFRDNPQFLRFNINTLLMDFGMWAIAPLFTIYYVNDLGATESWLGLLTTLGSLANIFGFGLGRKFVNRLGRTKVLFYTALLRPIYPLVVAFFPNLTAIILVSAITGILMPGLSLSHYSLMLDSTPNDKRDQFTAYYTMFQNISVFIAPLIGAAVLQLAGYKITFLIFGFIRLLGGLMWRILPVTQPEVNEKE